MIPGKILRTTGSRMIQVIRHHQNQVYLSIFIIFSHGKMPWNSQICSQIFTIFRASSSSSSMPWNSHLFPDFYHFSCQFIYHFATDLPVLCDGPAGSNRSGLRRSVPFSERRSTERENGKTLGKPWENLGKTLGKPRENLGKTLGKPWENLGKTLGKP